MSIRVKSPKGIWVSVMYSAKEWHDLPEEEKEAILTCADILVERVNEGAYEGFGSFCRKKMEQDRIKVLRDTREST